MAEGRGRAQWAWASALMALIANCNRDPKKSRPFKPSDFDPYSDVDARPSAIRIDEKSIGLMKEAFLTGKGLSKGQGESK